MNEIKDCRSACNRNASTEQVANFGLFVNYIKQFVTVLLNSTSNTEFEKTLNEKSSVKCLKKFIADS